MCQAGAQQSPGGEGVPFAMCLQHGSPDHGRDRQMSRKAHKESAIVPSMGPGAPCCPPDFFLRPNRPDEGPPPPVGGKPQIGPSNRNSQKFPALCTETHDPGPPPSPPPGSGAPDPPTHSPCPQWAFPLPALFLPSLQNL